MHRVQRVLTFIRGPGGVGRGVDLTSSLVLEGEDRPGLLGNHSLHAQHEEFSRFQAQKLRTSAEI